MRRFVMYALGIGILLPALTTGVPPEATAEARGTGGVQAETVDRFLADGLTREQMVGLYASLGSGGFEPPACAPGDEMFDDVPAANLFCPWIEELARRGITGGCTATSYCPGAAVTRAQMAAFVVRATAVETPHVVGTSGEPPFGDGGEGDCLWQNPPPDDPSAFDLGNPVSFYRDSVGIVHLAGLPVAFNGPDGDAVCDFTAADFTDTVIFRLPEGYQPEHLEVFFAGDATTGGYIFIAPQGGVTSEGGVIIPGGSVFTIPIEEGSLSILLDGRTFRAAPAATSAVSREPAQVSLQALRRLLHRERD